MVEKSTRVSLLTNNRGRMSLCIQLSVTLHIWIFMSVTSNAQAQVIRHEKATLLQALAYARRAGIDVSAYQQTLKEAPFEPGYEGRMELSKAVHSKFEQMIDQVDREISGGDADKVAANLNNILLVDTGGTNELSHSLLVHPDGTVEYTVDHTAAAIGSGRNEYQRGGKTGATKISQQEAARLFALVDSTKLQSIPASALIADRDDGNYLVQQIVYLDFADQTSPNLLCASSKEAKQLLDCCKKIELTTKINKIAQISAQ
jgi:hypothetical protein